jgi:hypothetical protein
MDILAAGGIPSLFPSAAGELVISLYSLAGDVLGQFRVASGIMTQDTLAWGLWYSTFENSKDFCDFEIFNLHHDDAVFFLRYGTVQYIAFRFSVDSSLITIVLPYSFCCSFQQRNKGKLSFLTTPRAQSYKRYANTHTSFISLLPSPVLKVRTDDTLRSVSPFVVSLERLKVLFLL